MAKYHFPVKGAISDGAIAIINEVELGFLTQLAGWDRFPEAADSALRKQLLSLPKDYRTSVRREGATVWRIAPDRVLIRSDVKLPFASSNELAALDLSDARICLSLEGPGAAGLLSRVITLDVSQSNFPVGTFGQTALHHVGVLIDRQGPDQFIILVPTTWAKSLIGFLIDHVVQAT